MIRAGALGALLAALASLAFVPGARAQDAGARCAALAHAPLAGGKVLSAGLSGADAMFDSGLAFTPYPRLPVPGPLCRVALRLSPVAGSDIRAELWLPLAPRWNGKLVEAGNGGFGGSLSDPMVTMRHAVLRGFAAAGNDMGHRADDTGWLMRREAVIDSAWRADRATSLAARALVARFYGRRARLTYYEGCSSGGRQALMAAQRFPGDYDGIVAGAPAAPYSDLLALGAWMQQQVALPGARPTAADLRLVGDAALAQCDGMDGVKDGLIADPRACRFDVMKLACQGPDRPGQCLAPAKVKLFAALYAGPRDAAGRAILPGMPVGAEGILGGWQHWITMAGSRHAYLAQGAIGQMVLRDPAWGFDRFDLSRDLPMLRRELAQVDAVSPDLSPLLRHGGRAIVWHGWADAGINPLMTIDWRDRVVTRMGRARADRVLALFMVPGLSHCFGGPGPDAFQMLDALDAWRDRGVAPERLTASWHAGSPFAAMLDMPTGAVTRTRPLCRYPRGAVWDGRGDPNRAESFACR